MVVKQFLGFKTIPKLKQHLKKEFPCKKVLNIRRGKTLQPAVKGGRTSSQHIVTFKNK